MQTIQCKNWEGFESCIAKLLETMEALRAKKYPGFVSTPLFRGHADSSWKLESTLDRFAKRDLAMKDYYDTIRAVRPAVVSITGKDWPLPEFKDTHRPPHPPIGYEFMIYLRHHGFPSPLLDWTQSPYVAAFFAFRSNNEESQAESVAIYSYVDFMEGGRAHYEGEPVIFALGPYAVTHKRHYSQQCEYTTCTKGGDGGAVYCSHELGIPKDKEGRLTKYAIPRTERGKAMKKLELMNITAFSLFGSEESLMETLAYKELEAGLLERLSRFENFRAQAGAKPA